MLNVQVYLNFNGNCEEAIRFYEKVFNGTTTSMMRYKEMPSSEEYTVPAEQAEWIMHADMTIDKSTFMFSDTADSTKFGDAFAVTMIYDTEDEVKRVFNELKDSAEITFDLAPTFFSTLYGLLTDKFGVHWIIMYQEPTV